MYPLGDLSLRHLFVESQLEDVLLPRGKRIKGCGECQPVQREIELVVMLPPRYSARVTPLSELDDSSCSSSERGSPMRPSFAASWTSSSDRSQASDSSLTVGQWPREQAMDSEALSSVSLLRLMVRGSLIRLPWSRRWFKIAPRIPGMARDEKLVPRSMSNFSRACKSPIIPIWKRSSCGSRDGWNRLQRLRTRGI